MIFAQPLAWGLLLLAIPIVLFFFLKIRFRKEAVATMMFWQQVFEERRTRTIRRRFRRLISLFLALLFLSLLVAAALDPTFYATQDHRIVLIIDNSSRMQALLPQRNNGTDKQTNNTAYTDAKHTDAKGTIEKTWLDEAKRKALERLNGAVYGLNEVAILTASTHPNIVSGFTDHLGTLRRKLTEISATDYPSDLSAAMQLAERLIAETPNAPIYIYTAFPNAALLATIFEQRDSPPNVHFVIVGEPIDNLAITRFQVRRLPEQATDFELFVEAVNFGSEPVQTRLEIENEGRIVDVLPLSLEPGIPLTRIVRNTSAKGGLFKATLADTDLFPADNEAIAFLSEQFVQRILLYGNENYFLWHALQSIPQTEVSVIDSIPDSLAENEVLVLHQALPASLSNGVLQKGNVLIIDPHEDCTLFRIEGTLQQPMVAEVDKNSTLVRFIQRGLLFLGAKHIIVETPSLQTGTAQTLQVQTLLATADGFPLYVQFSSEEQRTLVLTADLNQGEFSLRTAFPLLVSQALAYFRDCEDLQQSYATTDFVQVSVQTAHPQVILRNPSGQEKMLPCPNNVVSLGQLGERGVWTLIEPESERELLKIACNLFNRSESDLRETDSPLPSEEPPTMGGNLLTVLGAVPWFYLTGFALLLTITEWFLYQRRWIE